MPAAAHAFLELLDDEQRKSAQLAFEIEERFNWHYVPRPRHGLSIDAMTLAQRDAAFALLQSSLSKLGYEKTKGVIELENLLGHLTGNPAFRNPDLYYLTIFGDPAADAPWGWRFEGHHLSLNFTSVSNELVTTTPAFFGANPAEVPSSGGSRAGWRLLAAEEDLGRELVTMLEADQQKSAVIATRAPRDIITGSDRKARLEQFEGLSASSMNEMQRATLWQLIEAYTGTVDEELARAQLERLHAIPLDSLFFAWAGGFTRGEGHYYRIHSPRFLIEYDNSQDGANHVHAVWRDVQNDFGEDWLRLHYEAHGH